ncbi:LysO family transporter [Mycoplasmatota bacterium]|nr:LysO family transporter [Mycoplasmatota bacterium]
MWFIYISLCIGIGIGALNLVPKKIIKYNDHLSTISVFSLLFVMGISIGSNKKVINDLYRIGLSGLLYAFLSVLFSMLVVYILTGILFRGEKK